MKRLLMLTSAVAMIAMAALAYADPPSDADFISQLKAAGLTDQDPAAAIAVAKDMCSLVDKGTPDTEIESNLVSRNPGLTAHRRGRVHDTRGGRVLPEIPDRRGSTPETARCSRELSG